MNVVIQAAGVGRPGLSLAAAGAVVLDASGTRPLTCANYKFCELSTKQTAEYLAVYIGLRKAIELGAASAVVQIDSPAVVKGMTGVRPLKKRHSWAMRMIALEYAKRLSEVTYVLITPEENVRATELADGAMHGRPAVKPKSRY